jgi:hypothetical protein
MPVLRMNMGERPDNTGDVKAAGYLGILINVMRVIIVNEVMPERLPKHGPCKHYKTDADADKYPVAACFRKSN